MTDAIDINTNIEDWRQDLWHEVEHAAYLVDGESLEYKFNMLLGLREAFKAALSRPDFDIDKNVSDWAVYAVDHLLMSLTQHLDREYLAARDALAVPFAKMVKDALDNEVDEEAFSVTTERQRDLDRQKKQRP
jgi:hypothetical protein